MYDFRYEIVICRIVYLARLAKLRDEGVYKYKFLARVAGVDARL